MEQTTVSTVSNGNITVGLDVYILRFSTLPVIMFFSIFGNLLVCLVVYSKLHNVTNIMIFNLAFADLLMGTIVIPIILASTILNEWIGSDISCKIFGILNGTVLVESIWMLVIISVLRYILVAYPHRSHTLLTKRKAYLVVLITWIWSFASTATAELWSPFRYYPQLFDCWWNYSDPLKHQLLMTCLNVIIPFGIMIFSYVRIYQILHKQYRTVQRIPRSRSFVVRVAMKVGSSVVVPMMNKSQRSQSVDAQGNRLNLSRMKDDSKITRMMLIVIIAFVIAWSPGVIILQLYPIIKPISPLIFNFAFILGYSNSAINCFIYGFLNKTFRQSFEQILTFRKCRKYSPS